MENTAKKWTKRIAVAVVIILWVQLIRCCCAFPSSARERKRERERERSKRSQSPLFAALFLPSVKKVPTERDKNRTTNVSISVRFGHPKRFLSFGVRKRLRRRTKRYAPGDDFDDESGFFVFLFFFEKQRLH